MRFVNNNDERGKIVDTVFLELEYKKYVLRNNRIYAIGESKLINELEGL